MWKAIKWHGNYLNVYVKHIDSDLEIMYPPKQLDFINRHKQLLKSKGYEIKSENNNIVTYSIGSDDNYD